jgi:hypothetical protein
MTEKIVPKIFILVFLCFFVATPSLAGIQYVDVKVQGSGANLKAAIYDALKMALSQVNGTVMSARESASLESITVSTDDDSNFKSTEKFRQDVSAATKGVVKAFSIIRSSKNEDGEFEVMVAATIAKFELSVQTKRLRIAVGPFRIEGGRKRSSKAQPFEKIFRRGVENYLTQSRRFAILDRSFLREQDKEQSLLRGGDFSTEELARLGNRIGTDYLVTGVVEKAYSYSKKTTMRTTGLVIKTPQVGGKVTYRILDVASTQVKFADTSEIHREYGSLDSAADSLSKSVGQKIVNAIFPVYVLSVDGNFLTLGQGGKTVGKGSVYSLVRLGKRMIDPYTKEGLGRKETTVGSVKITDTQAKMSTAVILKLTISRSSLSNGDFIVRPRHTRPVSSSNSESMKKLEKDFEDEFEKEEKEDKEKW